MQITKDHLLDTAKLELIAGGSSMDIRRCVVIHFTSGATAQSSVDFWKHQNNGVLAHVIIDRDGSIIQCRAFNKVAGHAGVSRWLDPTNNEVRVGCNQFAIGIELANAGNDQKVIRIASRLPGYRGEALLKHRNESQFEHWELYPQAQLDSCFALVQVLKVKYNLDDITGHDCIAPERKNDPGPAFPMQELREKNGLVGLPHVNNP